MKTAASTFACALVALATSAYGEVPITVASTGHAVVPVDVEGHARVTFVLDTGADETVLYRHFADALGLATLSSDSLQGQTGAADVAVVRMPAFALDGRTFAARDTIVLPNRGDGAQLNGILGLDVMRDYVADIDYLRERFALRAASTDARTLVSAAAVRVPVRRLETGLMAFAVTINGATGTAVLDSGSRDTRLNGYFVRTAGLAPVEAAGNDAVILGATNSPVLAKPVVLGRFEVAGHTLLEFNARAVDLPVFDEFGLADEPALILGYDALRSARVVVDSARDTVWFDWTAARQR